MKSVETYDLQQHGMDMDGRVKDLKSGEDDVPVDAQLMSRSGHGHDLRLQRCNDNTLAPSCARSEEQPQDESSVQLPSCTDVDVAINDAEDNEKPAQEGPYVSVEMDVTKDRSNESYQTVTLATNRCDGVVSMAEAPVELVEKMAEASSEEQNAAVGQQSGNSFVKDAVVQDGSLSTFQLSSESLSTKSPGFFESLTADFAPDTKVMWAQIFGPRYEENGGEDVFEDTPSYASSVSDSVTSKSSLKAKLARERKLDEQIQASQRRYRERVLRHESTTMKQTRVKVARRPQRSIQTISPFEQAGLSLTRIRFCMEKALDETCKCFRRLHAVALEEAEDLVNPPTRGIYLTQGELDDLLHELFDPQESVNSNGSSQKGTVVAPLGFAKDGIVEGISMTTHLQASWLMPFGQLPQLRNLVMKTTRRHLNEEKVAIVNRHLQKQLTLLPFASKLQSLIVQLSVNRVKNSINTTTLPEVRSPQELVHDLLGCIAVSGEAHDYTDFFLFLPVEHVMKMQLASVIHAQRLVFFRLLIDILAAERSRLESKPAELVAPPLLAQTPAKRRSLTTKRSRRSCRNSVERVPELQATTKDSKASIEVEEAVSVQAVQGSLPSASEACAVNNPSLEDGLLGFSTQTGDECVKPVSQLQVQLESAIAQLRQTMPAIDSDVAYTRDAAVRATYLAAVACHQSVLLMLENNINVDTAMSDKLQHFIEALQSIHATDQAITLSSSNVESTDHQSFDSPRFPPPYPESPAQDEIEENESDRSLQAAISPPACAVRRSSSWTFVPRISESETSIATLVSKKPANLQSTPKGSSRTERPNQTSDMNVTVETYSIDKVTAQLNPSRDDGDASSFSASDASNSSRVSQSNVSTDTRDESLDALPSYTEANATAASHDSPETTMDRALRLQQRLFMDEFVQNVISTQGESPTHFVPRCAESPRQSNKTKPYWAMSDVSPGIDRLLHRQRRAPSVPLSKSLPSRSRRLNKQMGKKPAPSLPLRQQLDNDQHLAWAARISDLYCHTTE